MRTEIKVALVIGLVVIVGAMVVTFNDAFSTEQQVSELPVSLVGQQPEAAKPPELAGDKPPRFEQPSPVAAQRSQSTPPRPAEADRSEPAASREPGSGREAGRPGAGTQAPSPTAEPQADPTALPPLVQPDKPKPAADQPAAPAEDSGERSVTTELRPSEPAPQEEPPGPVITPPVRPGETILSERQPEVAVPPRDSAREAAGAGGSAGVPAVYTVQPGDTLTKIADALYGDPNLWVRIRDANPELKNPDVLRLGQTLKLPPKEGPVRQPIEDKPAEAKPAAPIADRRTAGGGANPTRRAATQPAAGRATYVVERGDTLTSIAREVLRDASRWREIYELNRDKLASPDVVPAGTELRLPALPKERVREFG